MPSLHPSPPHRLTIRPHDIDNLLPSLLPSLFRDSERAPTPTRMRPVAGRQASKLGRVWRLRRHGLWHRCRGGLRLRHRLRHGLRHRLRRSCPGAACELRAEGCETWWRYEAGLHCGMDACCHRLERDWDGAGHHRLHGLHRLHWRRPRLHGWWHGRRHARHCWMQGCWVHGWRHAGYRWVERRLHRRRHASRCGMQRWHRRRQTRHARSDVRRHARLSRWPHRRGHERGGRNASHWVHHRLHVGRVEVFARRTEDAVQHTSAEGHGGKRLWRHSSSHGRLSPRSLLPVVHRPVLPVQPCRYCVRVACMHDDEEDEHEGDEGADDWVSARPWAIGSCKRDSRPPMSLPFGPGSPRVLCFAKPTCGSPSE